MRHASDGVLRRLDDEPLAVPDRVHDHVAGCGRCSSRRAQIAHDTERAAALLSGPRVVPDTDDAWARLQRELQRDPGQQRRPAVVVRRPRVKVPTISLRAGLVSGAIGIVVAGTAAAASFTTVFAPTHVAPVSVSQNEMREVTAFIGLTNSQTAAGFSTPSGSTATRFGTLTWSSGRAHPASSLAQASAIAGFPVTLPRHRPSGVGAPQRFAVSPRVRATVTFNSRTGSLRGSSVTLDVGPAVAVEYGGRGQGSAPTLAIVTMPRPTAHSSGASMSQIEAFLLAAPGLPPELAEEIRLLGDLRTTLPVPVPAGAAVNSVRVGGWPGVLLADSSNAAAGVIWEDGRGMVHVVAGLLDSHDVLNVAGQIG